MRGPTLPAAPSPDLSPAKRGRGACTEALVIIQTLLDQAPFPCFAGEGTGMGAEGRSPGDGSCQNEYGSWDRRRVEQMGNRVSQIVECGRGGRRPVAGVDDICPVDTIPTGDG